VFVHSRIIRFLTQSIQAVCNEPLQALSLLKVLTKFGLQGGKTRRERAGAVVAGQGICSNVSTWRQNMFMEPDLIKAG
jgi:hypothetical protein